MLCMHEKFILYIQIPSLMYSGGRNSAHVRSTYVGKYLHWHFWYMLRIYMGTSWMYTSMYSWYSYYMGHTYILWIFFDVFFYFPLLLYQNDEFMNSFYLFIYLFNFFFLITDFSLITNVMNAMASIWWGWRYRGGLVYIRIPPNQIFLANSELSYEGPISLDRQEHSK